MVPDDGGQSPHRSQPPGRGVEPFGIPEGARERLPGPVPAFGGRLAPILVRVPVSTEKLAPGDPDPGLQQHVRAVPAACLRPPERDERLPPVSGRKVDLPEPQVRLRRRIDLLGEGAVEALRGVELAGAQSRAGDGEAPVQDLLPVRRIAEERCASAAGEHRQSDQARRPPAFAFPGFASLGHPSGLPVRPAASASPRSRPGPTPGWLEQTPGRAERPCNGAVWPCPGE